MITNAQRVKLERLHFYLYVYGKRGIYGAPGSEAIEALKDALDRAGVGLK